MSLAEIPVRFRYVWRRSRLLQIGFFVGVWLLGEAVARVTHLPIPGGIIGLAAMLVLFATGRMSLASTRLGAAWLIAEMLLFFVPAVMAVLDHKEFLGALGLKLFGIIVVGTVLVMATTALTVDGICRLALAREAARVPAE